MEPEEGNENVAELDGGPAGESVVHVEHVPTSPEVGGQLERRREAGLPQSGFERAGEEGGDGGEAGVGDGLGGGGVGDEGREGDVGGGREVGIVEVSAESFRHDSSGDSVVDPEREVGGVSVPGGSRESPERHVVESEGVEAGEGAREGRAVEHRGEGGSDLFVDSARGFVDSARGGGTGGPGGRLPLLFPYRGELQVVHPSQVLLNFANLLALVEPSLLHGPDGRKHHLPPQLFQQLSLVTRCHAGRLQEGSVARQVAVVLPSQALADQLEDQLPAGCVDEVRCELRLDVPREEGGVEEGVVEGGEGEEGVGEREPGDGRGGRGWGGVW